MRLIIIEPKMYDAELRAMVRVLGVFGHDGLLNRNDSRFQIGFRSRLIQQLRPRFVDKQPLKNIVVEGRFQLEERRQTVQRFSPFKGALLRLPGRGAFLTPSHARKVPG